MCGQTVGVGWLFGVCGAMFRAVGRVGGWLGQRHKRVGWRCRSVRERGFLGGRRYERYRKFWGSRW